MKTRRTEVRWQMSNRGVHWGSGGGGQNTVQTSTVKLPPQIAAQIQPFIDYTRRYVDRPFTPYTGQLVAPFGPDDLGAFARVRQDVRRPFNPDDLRYQRGVRQAVARPFTADDLDYFRRVRQSEFLTEQANPFFESQLDIGRRRLGEEYSERVAPGLASQYAISSAFGGSAHQEAMERSQRQFARGLQEYETGARSAEVERRRAERFAAEARLGQIGQTQRERRDQVLDRLGLSGAQQRLRRDQVTAGLAGIGDKQRQQAQRALDAQYGQFLRQQDYPDKLFSAYQSAIAALTGGAPRSTTSTTQTQSDTDPGQLASQVVGGTASAAALGYLAYLALGCWVAEELYGPTDRRTHAARLWVMRHNNVFTRLYRKYGRAWAAYLRRHPWQKPLWRLVWDRLVNRGLQLLAR